MSNPTERKRIASQILTAMLSNPHIYSQVSDEGASGRQEQLLILLATEMADELIKTIDRTYAADSEDWDEEE